MKIYRVNLLLLNILFLMLLINSGEKKKIDNIIERTDLLVEVSPKIFEYYIQSHFFILQIMDKE